MCICISCSDDDNSLFITQNKTEKCPCNNMQIVEVLVSKFGFFSI